MFSPKVALLVNGLVAVFTGLLALGSGVFADAGFPAPEKFVAYGLIFQAVVNPILHAYSSATAGPLARDPGLSPDQPAN